VSDLERSGIPISAELLPGIDGEAAEFQRQDDIAAAYPAVGDAAPPRSRRPRIRRKRFAEPTPSQARVAAGEWLRDFSRHGPLQIRRIATRPCSDLFLTEVTYTRW
jgi:hypothetical protein